MLRLCGRSPHPLYAAYDMTVTVSLARIIVSVTDLDRALAFYEGILGLEVFFSAGGVARLRSGTLEVMLHERPATPSDTAVAASFAVDDVDAVTDAAASAGAEVLDAPADQPWGERQSVLRDPDGHVVCLVTRLA